MSKNTVKWEGLRLNKNSILLIIAKHYRDRLKGINEVVHTSDPWVGGSNPLRRANKNVSRESWVVNRNASRVTVNERMGGECSSVG